MPSLTGKTVFISGASRGIGLAIALRAAWDGANIVVTGKTATPHAKLPGTVYTQQQKLRRLAAGRCPLFLIFVSRTRHMGPSRRQSSVSAGSTP